MRAMLITVHNAHREPGVSGTWMNMIFTVAPCW
jgi:hypothetical protein